MLLSNTNNKNTTMASQKNDSLVDSVFHYKKGTFEADINAQPKSIPTTLLVIKAINIDPNKIYCFIQITS